jgi:hypothetical protein
MRTKIYIIKNTITPTILIVTWYLSPYIPAANSASLLMFKSFVIDKQSMKVRKILAALIAVFRSMSRK